MFVIQYGNFLKLYLKIKFNKKDDYWIIESKKTNSKMYSTNYELDKAKNEFSEFMDIVIKKIINDKTIFGVLEKTGIKVKLENTNLNRKHNKLFNSSKRKNGILINPTNLMVEPFIILNRTEPKYDWI